MLQKFYQNPTKPQPPNQIHLPTNEPQQILKHYSLSHNKEENINLVK